MTIIDALKSGKFFRRSGDSGIWYSVENVEQLEKQGYPYTHTIYENIEDDLLMLKEKAEPFLYEDIIAEDWEVKNDTI